jgi:hypothetical protein
MKEIKIYEIHITGVLAASSLQLSQRAAAQNDRILCDEIVINTSGRNLNINIVELSLSLSLSAPISYLPSRRRAIREEMGAGRGGNGQRGASTAEEKVQFQHSRISCRTSDVNVQPANQSLSRGFEPLSLTLSHARTHAIALLLLPAKYPDDARELLAFTRVQPRQASVCVIGAERRSMIKSKVTGYYSQFGPPPRPLDAAPPSHNRRILDSAV